MPRSSLFHTVYPESHLTRNPIAMSTKYPSCNFHATPSLNLAKTAHMFRNTCARTHALPLTWGGTQAQLGGWKKAYDCSRRRSVLARLLTKSG